MQKKKKFSLKEFIRILCQEQFETFAAWDGWEIPFLDAFLIFASYIQVLSLSLSANYGISNGPYLLQVIFYVARPSGYLVTETDTVHGEVLIISWVCLIFLVFLHIFLSKHSIFRARLNYFLTFFNAYFLVILLEIGYAQLLPYFNSSITIDSESPLRALFGILLIIFSSIVSAFLCIFSEPNVRIYEVGLSRLSLSRTHSITHLLKHISVAALYIEYDKQIQCSAILLIIGIVILLSAAHDQRRHFPFSSLLKTKANSSGIAILAMGLILLTAIRECFELMSDTTSVILFLMSIPPAVKLACDYSESQFYYLIFVRWVRNTIPYEMEQNYQDLGFSTAQNSMNMYATNTLTMSMNTHINENDPDAGNENLTPFNDVFYFPLQLAYFARNRKNIVRDPNTKLMLLSAYQSHMAKCKNQATCQCTVLNKVGGVQEGRFAVLLDLQQNLLHQNTQHLLLSKRYLQTPSFQQAFFAMASYLISLNKNIFCLQRVIELLSQKKAMTLNRQFERGVWFKSGLEVFLKIIQDSMDICFLSDVDQNKDVYNTFKACQLFFKVEQVKQKNLLHVIDIVKTKIDVLKRVKSGVKDMQELKKINEGFQIVCEKCERSLSNFYEKVPTRDNQSLLCFFLSEVKSDLKKAQDIMGKRQFSNSLDMNLLLGTNTLMQVFSNAVHSIRAGFAKGSGALLWYSNSLPKFLGYSSQEFHYFQKVNDLLPHVLAFYHDDLVTEYLKAGESSEVFQNLKFGYLRHYMGWIQPVQMFININFMDLSQIGFFVFIQKQNALISTNEYILLDEDGYMESTSFGILERAGLQNIPFDATLGTLHAEKLIGEFSRAFEEINRLTTITKVDHRDVSLSIPNMKYFQDSFDLIEKGYSLASTSLFNSKRMSNKSGKLFVEYRMDYQIERIQRKLPTKDIKYFLLTVKKLTETVTEGESQLISSGNQFLTAGLSQHIFHEKPHSQDNKVHKEIEEDNNIFKRLNEHDHKDTPIVPQQPKPNLANPFFKYRNLILQKAKIVTENEEPQQQVQQNKNTTTVLETSNSKEIIMQTSFGNENANRMSKETPNPEGDRQPSNNLLSPLKNNKPPLFSNMYHSQTSSLTELSQNQPGIVNKPLRSAIRSQSRQPTRSYRRSTIVQTINEGDQVKLFKLRENSKRLSEMPAILEENNNETNILNNENEGRDHQGDDEKTQNRSKSKEESSPIQKKPRRKIRNQLSQLVLDEKDESTQFLLDASQNQSKQLHQEGDFALLSSVRNETDRLLGLNDTKREETGLVSKQDKDIQNQMKSITENSIIDDKMVLLTEDNNNNNPKEGNQTKKKNNQTNSNSESTKLLGLNQNNPIKIHFSDGRKDPSKSVLESKTPQTDLPNEQSISQILINSSLLESSSELKETKILQSSPEKALGLRNLPLKPISISSTKKKNPFAPNNPKKRRYSLPILENISSPGKPPENSKFDRDQKRHKSSVNLQVIPIETAGKNEEGESSADGGKTGKSKHSKKAVDFSHDDQDVSSRKSLQSMKSMKNKKDPSKQTYKNANQFMKTIKDIQAFNQKNKDGNNQDGQYLNKQKTIDSFSSHRKNKDDDVSIKLFNENLQGNNGNILPVTKEQNPINAKKGEQNNDQQSVASSLQKSIFSNKYDNFSKFVSKNNPADLQKLRFSKLAEFLVIFTVTLICNIIIFMSFSSFQTDLKVMKLRHSNLLPLSNSAALVQQQLKNDGFLASGAITSSEHASVAALISAHLTENYNEFSTWLNSNLAESVLQSVYTENNFQIEYFSSTNTQSVSLLMCALFVKRVLLIVQKNMEDQVSNTAVVFATEETTFILNNFHTIYDFFVSLSQQLTNKVSSTTQDVENYFIMQVVIIILGYIAMQAIQLYYYHSYTVLVRHILRLFETTTLPQIDSEVNRLVAILTLSESDESNLIFCYDFDLRAKEIALRKESKQILAQEEKHPGRMNLIQPQKEVQIAIKVQPAQGSPNTNHNHPIHSNLPNNSNIKPADTLNPHKHHNHGNEKTANLLTGKDTHLDQQYHHKQPHQQPKDKAISLALQPQLNNNQNQSNQKQQISNNENNNQPMKTQPINEAQKQPEVNNKTQPQLNNINQQNLNKSKKITSKSSKSTRSSNSSSSARNKKKRNSKNFRVESGKISFRSFLSFFSLLSIPLACYFITSFLLTYSYISSIGEVITSYHRFQDASSYLQSQIVFLNQVINDVPSALISTSPIVQSLLSSVSETSNLTGENALDLVNSLAGVDSSVENQVHSLLSTGVCDQQSLIFDQQLSLSSALLADALSRCYKSHRGMLNLGINALFSEILTRTRDIIKLNYSLAADSFYPDTDGVLLLIFSSKVISYCADLIHDTLLNRTVLYQYVLFGINLIFLFFTVIIYIYQLYSKHSNLRKEFKYSQHIIYLLPSVTLLTDETFFKQINYLNIKVNQP